MSKSMKVGDRVLIMHGSRYPGQFGIVEETFLDESSCVMLDCGILEAYWNWFLRKVEDPT